ncbi:hypothetical protein ACHAXH_008379 [Discostella pseudostelligera]|jgi:hypothetical protein
MDVSTCNMIFEDNAFELLKQGEAEQQKAIDTFCNLEGLQPSPSVASLILLGLPDKTALDGIALRQGKEDNLSSGDVTEDDHGSRYISDDDEFFEPPTPEKKKAVAMMEAQREILSEDEDFGELPGFDGSTATMEVDEEFKESVFRADTDEVSYDEEFTDYTYDASVMY